ncbi:hypothetical protein OH77DRAFT_99914 [Trametes cingulata]|nr:hypothetical protein OH77DRAFT_99914 [Trametes cingulata]
MSTHAPSESTATFYSQMARAVSMFSDTFTSVTVGSRAGTGWAECGSEGPYMGSPVVKRCARLEAEVVQLRKRIKSEMSLLPIVKSTDAGGLACEFMFPARSDSRRSSASSDFLQVATVSRNIHEDVEDMDVADAEGAVVDNGSGDRVRTERPQVVDPEGGEEARVTGIVIFDVEDSEVVPSPSEDIVDPHKVDPVAELLPSPVLPDQEIWHDKVGRGVGGLMKGVQIEDDASDIVREEDSSMDMTGDSFDVAVCPVVIAAYGQDEEVHREAEDTSKILFSNDAVVSNEEGGRLKHVCTPAFFRPVFHNDGIKEDATHEYQPEGTPKESFKFSIGELHSSIGTLVKRPRDASSAVPRTAHRARRFPAASTPRSKRRSSPAGDAAPASPADFLRRRDSLPAGTFLKIPTMSPLSRLAAECLSGVECLSRLSGASPGTPSGCLAGSGYPRFLLSTAGLDDSLLVTPPQARVYSLGLSEATSGDLLKVSASSDAGSPSLDILMTASSDSSDLSALSGMSSSSSGDSSDVSPAQLPRLSSLDANTSQLSQSVSMSSPFPCVWPQSSVLQTPAKPCADPLFAAIDVLLYLLLGASLCLLLSSPAVCVFFWFIWVLFGMTTRPLSATMTASILGGLRCVDELKDAQCSLLDSKCFRL